MDKNKRISLPETMTKFYNVEALIKEQREKISSSIVRAGKGKKPYLQGFESAFLGAGQDLAEVKEHIYSCAIGNAITNYAEFTRSIEAIDYMAHDKMAERSVPETLLQDIKGSIEEINEITTNSAFAKDINSHLEQNCGCRVYYPYR